MEFFKKNVNINVMKWQKYTGLLSFFACIFSLIALLGPCKLNLALDFTGGTQAELRFMEVVSSHDVRVTLEKAGFQDVRVQQYGSAQDLLVRFSNKNLKHESEIRETIQKELGQKNPLDIKRIEVVGSEVGSQLAEQGGSALLLALAAMMIYVAVRFEYRLAVGAAVALCHDIILVLGIFSLCKIEFDLATLAAILAILGYSLNDTIVVFDRVRENARKLRVSAAEIMNLSINQTLSRTIMTSLLTLLVVIALLVFGGHALFSFSLALFLGIIIGTYSSIYVAGSLALLLGLNRSHLVPKPKSNLDYLP